jgi:REP element-mobilizing transposase RayT
MARQPRNESAGSTYHVTIHGVADTAIVRTDRDRTILVESFAETAKRYRWQVIALAILDTHYHALVHTPEATLGAGMQYLNGTYAQGFNRRHGRRGHLFGARYFSKAIESEAQFTSRSATSPSTGSTLGSRTTRGTIAGTAIPAPSAHSRAGLSSHTRRFSATSALASRPPTES